jgi:hypothetical protein
MGGNRESYNRVQHWEVYGSPTPLSLWAKHDVIEVDCELPGIPTSRQPLGRGFRVIIDKAESVDPPREIALWQVKGIGMPVACRYGDVAPKSPIQYRSRYPGEGS